MQNTFNAVLWGQQNTIPAKRRVNVILPWEAGNSLQRSPTLMAHVEH
jgi:hypothetical protein